MGANRDDQRRANRRALRPTVDDRLESRMVLSTASGAAEIAEAIAYVRAGARPNATPPFRLQTRAPRAQTSVRPAVNPGLVTGDTQFQSIRTYVSNGGRGVRILDGHGDAFDVRITGVGTVTARPMHDGRVKIIAMGTNPQSEMIIHPVNVNPQKGQAHTFNPEFGIGDDILEVGGIEIRSGRIGQVLGYRTANLSGPLIVRNAEAVDRIALNSLKPGALIQTGGDLNTLNVFGQAELAGAGTGIVVGRDLNWFTIGGNLNLADGAVMDVSRDVGLSLQPVKGTSPAGQGGLIQGNLGIAPGSAVLVGRATDALVLIQGSYIGDSATRVLSPTGGWIALGPPIV